MITGFVDNTWYDLALNPGSEYGNGLLRGVLVEVNGGRVATHQWTCG